MVAIESRFATAATSGELPQVQNMIRSSLIISPKAALSVLSHVQLSYFLLGHRRQLHLRTPVGGPLRLSLISRRRVCNLLLTPRHGRQRCQGLSEQRWRLPGLQISGNLCSSACYKSQEMLLDSSELPLRLPFLSSSQPLQPP